MLRLALLVVPVLALPPSLPAEVDLEAARTELLGRLEEHADWCQEEKLYAAKREVLELVLRFDPDHAEARKGLGFRRSKGEWVPPSREREVKDRNPDALEEEPVLRRQAVLPYCDAVCDLLEADELEQQERARLEADALALDPDHARLRALRGEVLHEDEWVLADTERSARTRAELRRMVEESLRGAPASAEAGPREHQRDIALPFVGRASGSMLVLTTGTPAEAEELGRTIHAAQTLYHRVLGERPDLPLNLTLYAVDGTAERDALLSGLSVITDEERARYAQLEGAGLTNGDWGWWIGNREKRLDALTRMAIGYFFLVTYGAGEDQGWLREGLGLYLTKALVGTRQTWFVSREAGGEDAAKAMAARNVLLDPTTNWMTEAHARLTDEDGVALESIFGKSAGSLTVDDLLLGYALSAWLVEAHPEHLRPVLIGLKRGADAARTSAVLEQVLGLDPPALRARLARWVKESHAEEFTPPVEASNLLARWDAVPAEERPAVAARLVELVDALDTPQLRRVRALTARVAGEVDGWPAETRPEVYDPKEHAPAQPIRRRWLDEENALVRIARRTLLRPPDPEAPRSRYRYAWGTREIVVRGDQLGPDDLVANAANGHPPGIDLALVVTLRDLDAGHNAAEQRAFDHAYTDRQGGVYPGITLFDAWRSRKTIEMPDVDVLGIVHDVWDDWTTWVAPIPGSEHEYLYGRLQRLYEVVRAYRSLREELAILHLTGTTPSSRYRRTRTQLHALWSDADDDPETLADLLPRGRETDRWLEDWVYACTKDGRLFDAGKRRRSQARQDSEEVRRALARALEEFGF